MRATSFRVRSAFVLPLLAALSPLVVAQPDSGQLPSGGVITAGQAAIAQQGSQMTVDQASQSAILNWQSFNIGADAGVTFNQPDASSVALNRVGGEAASEIYGSLNANGQVFLVNPNGVLFAPGAQVDVGGLVASTLDISNQNFLNGNYRFQRNGATGSIMNSAGLSAEYVAMLAPEVVNNGVIAARMVALAGGEEVSLSLSGNQLIDITVDQASIDILIENRHLVKADDGQVILSAQSANGLLGQIINSGTIEANGLVNDGGVIRLVASDSIELDGSITADAGENGNGGSIIAIANLDNASSLTQVNGTLSAQGGSTSGNGGFVETSASYIDVSDAASVNTLAANGQTGTWLLDPYDFTIAAVGGDITGSALSAALGSSSVEIETTDSAAGCQPTPGICGSGDELGNGHIYINDAISWNSATTLYLTAYDSVFINAPIDVNHASGGIELNIGTAYFVNAPVNLATGAGFAVQTWFDVSPISYTVINDQAGLEAISSDLTGYYALGSDISLTGTDWASLGDQTTDFDGVFDGLGHTIDGLNNSTSGETADVGLFGSCGDLCIISNVGLTNVNITGSTYVGALAGYSNGWIENAYATGTVTGFGTGDVGAIGGLVGQSDGIINAVYADVDVTATTGTQSGNPFTDGQGGIGGLAGVANVVSNSYALGDVTGVNYVGGLVGYSVSGADSSFAAGAVSGTTNEGGLFGGTDYSSGFPFTFQSYYDATVNSGLSGGGTVDDDVTGASTADLQTASTFVGAGWDSTVWELQDGAYPRLKANLIPIFVYADDVAGTYTGSAFTAFSSTISYDNSFYTGSVNYTTSPDDPAVDAGVYGVLPSGLTATDSGYRFEYVSGTLTINAAPLTVITGSLVGSTTKVYDGTTAAILNSANFELLGWQAGEGADVFITETAGIYDDADAGSNKNVTVSLEQGDFSFTTTDLSNYTLPTSVSGNIGEISRRPITATLIGSISRIYDGSTDADVGFANYSYDTSNFVGGDGAYLGGSNSWESGNFDTKNVGTGKTIIVDIDPADYVAVGSTNLSNYMFVDEATGVENRVTGEIGAITPLAVNLTAPVVSRAYNGGLVYAASASDLTFLSDQLVGGDTVTDADIAFTDKNASDGDKTIEFIAATINDGNSGSNYDVTYTGNSSSTIAPREIVADFAEIQAATREYDGTDEARLNIFAFLSGFTGFVEGEGVLYPSSGQDGFEYIGTFDSANAGERQVDLSFADWEPVDGGHVNNADPSNYLFPTSATASGTITPIALTISGTTVDGRVYDGTANATVIPGVLSGLLGSEQLNISATGLFDSANTGSRVATATYTLLDGANGGIGTNYTLDSTSGHAATITPKALTISGTAALDRSYDGTTNAGFTPGTLNGLIGSEQLVVTATGQFDSRNVGSRTTTATYQLADGANGGLAANYSLASTSGHSATISPLAVELTAPAITRTYDGTMAYSGTIDFSSLTAELGIAGDSVTGITLTYADANAGTGKSVTPSSAIISDGNGGNNYTVSSYLASSISTITPRALTISGTTAVGRVYDGTTTATITPGTLSGLIGSELLDVTATGLFDSRNAGSRTATATYQLADGANGGLAANYSLASTSGHSATISPLAVELTAPSITRVYDGTTSYSGIIDFSSLTAELGIAGDSVLGISLTYADANAGTGKSVTPSSAIISDGNGGNNYTVSSYLASSGSSITPKALTISGTTAASRAYDGTTEAVITPGNLVGLIGAEELVVTATGVFDSRNAGSRTATATYQLADGANGGLVANYSMAPTTSGHFASITPKVLSISGTTAASRAYDGTTEAVVTPGNLVGLIGAEELVVTATGVFDSRNAGNRTATATYQLADGANDGLAGNYSLFATTGHEATINPRAVQLTAPAITKVYDGNTAYRGAIDYSPMTADLGVSGDRVFGISLNYSDANAGQGKTVIASNARISDGNGGNNYSLSYLPGTNGTITGRPLNVVGLRAVSGYINSPVLIEGTPSLSGLVAGHTVNLGNIPTSSDWYYDNPRLDGFTDVRLRSGNFFTLSGPEASNYILNPPVLSTLLISSNLTDVVATALSEVEGFRSSRIYGGVVTFANLYNVAGFESRVGTVGSGGGALLALNSLRQTRAQAQGGQITAEQEQQALDAFKGQIQGQLGLLCNGRCEFSDAQWDQWYSGLE